MMMMMMTWHGAFDEIMPIPIASSKLRSWNLLLCDKEDTINSLQEKLTHVKNNDLHNKQKFDLENKEFDLNTKEELFRQKNKFTREEQEDGLKAELDGLAREDSSLNNKELNPLTREEQASLKAELDALAREESSLNNLLFSITDALSTVQVRIDSRAVSVCVVILADFDKH